MARARRGFIPNLLGSLAVGGLVALIAFGLPFVDRSLPASRPLAVSAPYRVGAGVAVVPPPGSRLDLTRTRPDDDRGTAVFVVDGVRIQVVVAPFRGDLAEAAHRLRGKITNSSGYQITGRERGTRTLAGVWGVYGSYSSSGVLGQYAVFVHEGLSIEITVTGPEDRLPEIIPALDASVRSLTVDGPRS